MKKYTKIHKLSSNNFLNLFKLDALTDAGRPFEYFFVSRRKEEAERILKEEKVSIRAAYLLMNFIHSDENMPFAFI